ncbi:cytochrome c3 family protein [Neobacillus sp. PS3-12]|uniref:cytochrome c3 family protein n=1 Tax=Neobacillus sp. PS3-12 TaxID=3070677 RepID=UPI0027E1B478|nr:cytochrome c3 family protein [Neobacillus sp. PS3-12]WML54727.1 cytochrome c3 family protein [Neobacillus sp. PS3-12]
MRRKNFKRKIFSCIAIWSIFIGSFLLYSPYKIDVFAAATDTGVTSTQTTSTDNGTTTTQPAATTTVSGTTTTQPTATTTVSGATTTQQTVRISSSLSQPAALASVNRPYVSDVSLVGDINDQSTYLSAEDMTQVPVNDIIRVAVRNSGTITNPSHLLEVSSASGDKITGTQKLVTITAVGNGVNEYVFTFTPDPANLLQPGTSYYVYLNPGFTNDDGNRIIPRFFKFTTISLNTQYQFESNEYRQPDVIHGNFSNVTNSCDYCHGVHNGSNDMLQGGKFGENSDNLCMACHDGTNGTPMPDKYNSTNQHAQINDSSSCTSCHDPHSDWSKDNPNHINRISNTTAQTYNYKKASTSTGTADDFSLCLSCHDGTKASNIKQYYANSTYTSQSGHKITATGDSGSTLNGQLPCAECHETHGSTNMKMLRDKLGNIQITDNTKKFTSSGTTWDAANERNFCLNCHSDSKELYGKTANLPLADGSGNAITGHQQSDTQGCSSCHGGTSHSFIEAAHAPSSATP